MKDIEKWKELFFKLPKILTYFVLFMIPFSGLVLDSFNIGGYVFRSGLWFMYYHHDSFTCNKTVEIFFYSTNRFAFNV